MTRWLWLLPVAGVLAVLAAITAIGLPTGSPAPETGPGTGPGTAPEPVPGSDAQASASDRSRVTVVARYAHDKSAFTQGLLWHGGKLYETTGLRGRSRLRRWDLDTGEVEEETRLSRELFGEGLARVEQADGAELIWLTWKAGRALRFDARDFSSRGEFQYSGEGWGLALCRGELFRSDGTAILWRHDPVTFAVRGRLEATRDGRSVGSLNELECTPRGLLANIWQSDEIVRIDPSSGRVTSTLDAAGLLQPEERRLAGVMNGIAYRPETDTVLLTGKNWPWLFEVVLEAD